MGYALSVSAWGGSGIDNCQRHWRLTEESTCVASPWGHCVLTDRNPGCGSISLTHHGDDKPPPAAPDFPGPQKRTLRDTNWGRNATVSLEGGSLHRDSQAVQWWPPHCRGGPALQHSLNSQMPPGGTLTCGNTLFSSCLWVTVQTSKKSKLQRGSTQGV